MVPHKKLPLEYSCEYPLGSPAIYQNLFWSQICYYSLNVSNRSVGFPSPDHSGFGFVM